MNSVRIAERLIMTTACTAVAVANALHPLLGLNEAGERELARANEITGAWLDRNVR